MVVVVQLEWRLLKSGVAAVGGGIETEMKAMGQRKRGYQQSLQ